MKKAFFFLCLAMSLTLLVRLLTGPGGVRAGGTVKSTISITARVDEFSEWADDAPVIFETDWSGAITHVNQKQTAARSLVLYTNASSTISIRPGLNNGILTKSGGSAQALDTAYRVTGDVAAPDAYFKPAGVFFSGQNVYTVTHVAGTGTYHINLEVQMASPATTAPDEGVYTCGIMLTAGW